MEESITKSELLAYLDQAVKKNGSMITYAARRDLINHFSLQEKQDMVITLRIPVEGYSRFGDTFADAIDKIHDLYDGDGVSAITDQIQYAEIEDRTEWKDN